MTQLYRKLQAKNIALKHVCEVGVYLPETSNVIDFIKNNIKATLVEADPNIAKQIQEYYKPYNVTVIPCAVWDINGTLTLSRAASSTFATELHHTPALINDGYIIRITKTTLMLNVRYSRILMMALLTY